MIPVSALYDYCHKMIDDHWGYIWGTAGKLWTQRDQDNADREMTIKYGAQWIGHMVTDCSGVMVYIWRQYGLSIPHGSTSMVRQGYIVDCGPVPHPGWAALVDKTPDTPDNDHIGIVMEDGITVFEAKGTQAGCVYSKVTDAKWTKFGRFRDVDYGGSDVPVSTPYKAVVTTASGSLNVRSGPGTEYAVIGKLSKGSEVTVMAHTAGWEYIQYSGGQGYCSAQYLTPVGEDPEPAPDPVAKDYTVLRSKDGTTIKLYGEWEVI